MTIYQNVSNPAALGCEVSDHRYHRFQLVVLRGVEGVRFSTCLESGWTPMQTVAAPERFAPATPKNYREMHAFAMAFVGAL